jgi:hypothetical protein
MAEIFISYSRSDQGVVRELVALLERMRLSVWWDRDSEVGSEFEELIDRELKSAGCVVVVWSRTSCRSTWVRSEAREGLERNVLVPVQIEDCEPPLPFRGLQVANLRGWPLETREEEIHNLTASIQRLLAGSKEMPAAPFRNDPTLSTRVAARVIDALNRAEPRISRALVLERAIVDLTVGLLTEKEQSLHHVKTFADAMLEVLDGGFALLRHQRGHLRVTTALSVGRGPVPNEDLLARRPEDSVVLLLDTTEQGLRGADMAWLLRIGCDVHGVTLAFGGDRGSPPPPPTIRKRLHNVARVLALVDAHDW